MKKLLLALALLLAPTGAFAQCNGSFSAAGVCGSINGGPPGQVPFASIPAINYGFYTAPGMPWVDVRSGANGCAVAKGDGATDDTAAFQCQINFMYTTFGGGVVNVPVTTSFYLFSGGGITLKGGVQLVGAGPSSTIIKVLTDSTVITVDAATCTKYPAIKNLFIEGYNNAGATHDTISIGANCPAIVSDVYVWFGNNAINTAGIDTLFFNTFACAKNDAIKSSGAGWFVRVKMDSGCGASGGVNGFEQVAGAASVEENHFSESDFDGPGVYTNSILINDGVGTQAITMFDNSIFSSPITITNALFTSFSKAEFGSATFTASGNVSITGSLGFSTTTPSGGTVTCSSNDNIVCPSINATFTGGTGAGSSVSLKSTTNGTPSGDSATVQGSSINLTNLNGIPVTVNCGTAGQSSCTYTMAGFSSGSWFQKPAAVASGGITWPAGTTDFSATGGASQVIKQITSGAPFTVGRLACSDLSNAGTTCPLNANTGLTVSGSNLNSNAELIDTFAPGPVTSITNTKGGFTAWAKASTVDNLTASASQFTCSVTAVITMYECGTSPTCAAPIVIGGVGINAAGTAVSAQTLSSTAISAGDYTAWEFSAGTCTALDAMAKAQVHSN